jgi:hypothetical protein
MAEMAGDWTDEQNDAIVADYFAMLADDLAERPYSKAEHNRMLQAVIGPDMGGTRPDQRRIDHKRQGQWIVHQPAERRVDAGELRVLLLLDHWPGRASGSVSFTQDVRRR